MFRTHSEVAQLENVVKKHVFIECDQQGYWKTESTCHRINKMLRCHNHEDLRLVAIGQAFCHLLDELEKDPILFDAGDEGITKSQKSNFQSYLELADSVIVELNTSSAKEVQAQIEAVKTRVIALQYRFGATYGGINREIVIDEELCMKLLDLAYAWKNKQKLYPKNDKTLKDKDIDKMVDACRYPVFVKWLLSNRSLQDVFFKWTIRDNNKVEQFIEFPGICARLRATFLDKRFGRLNPEELAIQIKQMPEYGAKAWSKDICLPFFDGNKKNRISILDESQIVVLNGNRRVTIKYVFEIFAQKSADPGNLCYFETQGITNWRVFECGSWNPETKSYERPDLNSKDWWKQLPVFEIVTKEEAEKRYAVNLKRGEWIKSIKSSRETLDYDLVGRHSYVEIVIPQDNGSYAVYPFGIFPKYYPTQKLQQMHLITQTVEARVSYADENTLYSQRQQAAHSKVISEESGLLMMERIRQDIVRGIKGELPFQIKGENCSHWAQVIFNTDEKENSCDFFKMPLLNMKPTHIVVDKLLSLPTPILNGLYKGLRFFANIEGMFVMENGQRLYKVTPFPEDVKDDEQFQPGQFFGMIEEQRLNGMITFGN